MASSSNPLPEASAAVHEDLQCYLFASNTNVCNFVSVKLSGNHNYRIWKTQMLCLMEAHDMCGIVDAAFDAPRASSAKIRKQYDRLLKGWIFGSVNEDVLVNVMDLSSAKSVWEKLTSIYGNPTISFQQDSPEIKQEAEETTNKDVTPQEPETEEGKEKKDRIERNKWLHKATVLGNWLLVNVILEKYKDGETEELNSDGNTILHLAVGIGHKDFVKNLLDYIKDDKILETRNKNGSTALHIAAIVGNKDAAELLVRRNKKLLTIIDDECQEPLLKAYSNMQFDTFIYLWNAANGEDQNKHEISGGPHIKKGVKLLVNAISAKQYSTASELINKFPEFAIESDDVLTAIARTFPSGLTNGETLIYPSLDVNLKMMAERATWFYRTLTFLLYDFSSCTGIDNILEILFWIIYVLGTMFDLVIQLIQILLSMIYLIFSMLYFLLWKVTTIIVGPVMHIERKKKQWKEATRVLIMVCTKIDELKFSGTRHPYYDRPILKAARQNAFKVVDEILYRSPETIQSVDKNGCDIIQLAVMHRSEKIFNLIYQLGEHKGRYRTFKDSSGNNILHLVGRLAPSHELDRTTGAALQLQRELQWHEEVKKFVFPTFITAKNVFKETPNMVFTREHEHLVKEGEKWMKTTAESCSIAAALIITIVFAAAITVPGGSDQATGIPLFTNTIAFIIFAISNAISLFTSCTSLLVFLSILTARFSEKDFLVSLPRRLIIGLCTLLISTTAMMVAFSAILFIVFCHKKRWMLAPICGLACVPIGFSINLQFPLIIDLFRSTYGRNFGYREHGRFDPTDAQGFYGSNRGRRDLVTSRRNLVNSGRNLVTNQGRSYTL